jgi:hypothetical protein
MTFARPFDTSDTVPGRVEFQIVNEQATASKEAHPSWKTPIWVAGVRTEA